MKRKRLFTKFFTEEDMKAFAEMLKQNDSSHLFWSYYDYSYLENETFIELDTGNTLIRLTDFDVVFAYNNPNWDNKNLSLEAVNLLKSIWTRFVYDNQKSVADKRAYKKAYYKFVDKTAFGKTAPNSKG